MSDDDSRIQDLIDWLHRQPAGTLPWGDDHKTFTPQLRRASWVDVVIPAACTDLGWNWLWTIVSPSDEDVDEAWPVVASTTLAVPEDTTVLAAWNPQQYWFDEHSPVGQARDDGTFDPDVVSAVSAAADACGGSVEIVPAWTNAHLSNALRAWTHAMTGRDDLDFAYDPEITSPRLGELGDVDTDALETFDLGDGVHATGPVLDALLADGIETASEIMTAIKDATAQLRATRPAAPDGAA